MLKDCIIKMKLIKSDYIMFAALILLVATHITTNFLIKYYEEAAQQVGIAEEVVMIMEQNPMARLFFNFVGIKAIYSYIIAPGLLIGLYYFIRRKYFYQAEALEAYAVSFFAFMFLNFMNDISIALGVLA